jgi:hypothetical protein
MNSIGPQESLGIQAGRLKSFQMVMRVKVRDALLVSRAYDRYPCEEDGQLSDPIRKKLDTRNLRHPAEITYLAFSLDLLRIGNSFDLIRTTPHIDDKSEIPSNMHGSHPLGVPVVFLVFHTWGEENESTERQPPCLNA